MKDITIKEACNRAVIKDFVQLPKRIYAHNDCYVPDLDSDVRDSLKGAHGFVAYDSEGNAVGRVATIINQKANEKWNRRAVRFSLIDFIDDVDVARALLQQVEQWGASQGMDMVLGPLGLYDFDKEGMLIEGFDRLGSMIEYYNHPYYPRHLEALGYTKAVDWVQTRMAIPTEVPKQYARIAEYARTTLGLKVKKVTNEDIIEGGYGHRIFDLLNEAYSPLFGFVAMPPEKVDDYINRYIRLIDKRLLTVVEDSDDNIVGACITMGSLSHALRKANGKLWPTGWWHLLRALRGKHDDTVELLLIAVKPQFQGYGVNALFFEDLIPIYNELGFKWAETGPQLEDNFKELGQWRPLHPEVVKVRRCYQKQLTNPQESNKSNQ